MTGINETRVFSVEDQNNFAEWSGDFNPMHLDPVYARRTQMGAPVVHGVHTTLWCLDALAKAGLATGHATRLQLRFFQPVYLGDPVAIVVTKQTETELDVRCEVGGRGMLSLRLWFESGTAATMPRAPERSEPPGWQDCKELGLEDMKTQAGTIRFGDSSGFSQFFPHAAAYLGLDRVQALAALSRLVGMECPGKHSIFSSFNLKFPDTPRDVEVSYTIAKVEDRYRLVRMNVTGPGLDGAVEAYVRQPPVRQLSASDVAASIVAGEFAGVRALIVGGSRGLGELAAKIIAVGGGRAAITYASGADEAEAVVREITDFGAAGSCEAMRYDVTGTEAPAPGFAPNQIYYFATCQIFRRKLRFFEQDVFDQFLKFYVNGFLEVCERFITSDTTDMAVFYPSSIAVSDRPKGLVEYAMAKAAGEQLCDDLKREYPGLTVLVERLPRILTDQTATVTEVVSEEAVDVILPIVRRMTARSE